MKKALRNELLIKISKEFKTFGDGQLSSYNPLVNALSDRPLQFAAGVDVLEVVQFIEKFIKEKKVLSGFYPKP